ncbi:MAG: glucosylglycerol hydrolase [Prochloraceae cyanobacterium]
MVKTVLPPVQIVEAETQKLIDWVNEIERSDDTIFHKAQKIVTRLGARYRADGLTEIGFWTPELAADMIQPKNIYLQVFTPKKAIDPTKPLQKVPFRRDYVQLEKHGDYHWGVVSGMRPGTKDELGSFYWLRYLCFETNEIKILGDCLADSYPYGVYAPAELYDIDRLQRERDDLAYFQQGDKNENGEIQVHLAVLALETRVSGFMNNILQYCIYLLFCMKLDIWICSALFV